MQKVGICLLACDALLGLGDLGAGGKTLHMRELWSLGTADVPTTHTGCSPKLALGFVISLFFIFFSLNLSTSFSLLYFSHSSLQPFIHCLDCISFFPPPHKWGGFSLHLCVGSDQFEPLGGRLLLNEQRRASVSVLATEWKSTPVVFLS